MAKFCPFCEKYYKLIVWHFKKCHSDQEVFVSRISDKTANFVTQNKPKFIKYKKGYIFYLRATCIFCEEEKDFPSDYWIEHIRGHTGEYGNKCYLCQTLCSSHTHCGMATERTDHFNLMHHDLSGYRCTDCNYVQLKEDNIRSHLSTQHNFVDIDENYVEFTILESLDSLPQQHNPLDVLIQGMPLFGNLFALLPHSPICAPEIIIICDFNFCFFSFNSIEFFICQCPTIDRRNL